MKRTTKSTSQINRTLTHHYHLDEGSYHGYSPIVCATHAFELVGRAFNFGKLWLKLFTLAYLSSLCGWALPIGAPTLWLCWLAALLLFFDESLTPTDVLHPHLKTRLAAAILMQCFTD